MALTYITNIPSTLDVTEGDPISLTVELSSDNPSVDLLSLELYKDGSLSNTTPLFPPFVWTETINPASVADSGEYWFRAEELFSSGGGTGVTAESTHTTVTVNSIPTPTPTPTSTSASSSGPVPGRTWEEHRRLRHLGYI